MIRAIFRTKTTRPKITDVSWTASGPRYRGSNPCLPATLAHLHSSLVWLLGTSLGKHRDVLTHAANGSESLPPSQVSKSAMRYSPKHTMLEPTARAMNCCPPDAKVIGEVLMVAFSGTRHNVFPSRSSTATT